MEWVPKNRVVKQGRHFVFVPEAKKRMPREDEVRCDTRHYAQAKRCGNGKNEFYCCYFCPKNSTCKDGCRNSPDRCGWERHWAGKNRVQ